MPVVSLSPLPIQHFVDNYGNALSGGKLFTYAAGTTTKLATYTTSAGTTTNTNPIILNTRGEASIWLANGSNYKFVLSPASDTDPPTSPIWTQDNISPASSTTLNQSLTGQFWQNLGAVVNRIADRLFVGQAILNAGNASGAADWLNTYQAPYPLDPMNLTQFAVLTNDPGEVAVLGGARSLNHTVTTQSSIGVAGYAYNNNTTLGTGGWSYYGESYRLNNTVGRTYGAELCVINQSGATIKMNPYSVPAGASIGVQLDSGNSFGVAQQPGLSPSSGAMLFVQNTNDSSSPFETGICVLANAIALNTNGFSEALSLPAISGIQWYTPGTSPASFINCTTTASTTAGQILLQNVGLGITAGAANSPVAQFSGVAGSVNFLNFTPGVATVSPSISASGNDTNISVVVVPKGTGNLQVTGSVVPTTDNTYLCGANGVRWSAVWAANGTIQTSDRSMKTDIASLPSVLPILLGLNPVTFKWLDGGGKPVISTVEVEEDVYEDIPDTVQDHEVQTDGSVHLVTKPITRRVQVFDQVPVTLPDGTPVIDQIPYGRKGQRLFRSEPRMHPVPRKQKVAREVVSYVNGPGKRTHWGFLADEIKTAFDKVGMDFGGYVMGEDGTEGYRADQLLAVTVKAVQELAAAVAALERKNP